MSQYCPDCGTQLIEKEVEHEGLVPYCPHCGKLCWPTYNVAVSMLIHNPAKDKVLLVQQYGNSWYRLVAGYVNKGESAEHALVREVQEEMGMNVTAYVYNGTAYYEPSNTLMINFACVVDDDSLEHSNYEIDHALWCTYSQAQGKIDRNSTAGRFLDQWIAAVENGSKSL